MSGAMSWGPDVVFLKLPVSVHYCLVRVPCTTAPGEAFMALISLPWPTITMFHVPSEYVADTVQSEFTVYGPESLTGKTTPP